MLIKIKNKDTLIFDKYKLKCSIGKGGIKKNKIELTAELFSVDGKRRFFIKEDDDIENHMILAKKIAGDLKIKSKGSYKG